MIIAMFPLQLMKAVIMARKSERPSLVLTQEQRTTLQELSAKKSLKSGVCGVFAHGFRFFRNNGMRLRHLVQIAQSIQRFEASTVVSVSRDKTDDKFIGLAIDSGAAILISGDPDLKDVKAYKGVEILSPAQFFERFKIR